jgi:hypothetical protein
VDSSLYNYEKPLVIDFTSDHDHQLQKNIGLSTKGIKKASSLIGVSQNY